MASTIPAPANADIQRLVGQLVAVLGYAGDPAYFTPNDDEPPSHRHAIRLAFKTMNVVGCFGFLSHGGAGRSRFAPAVYVAVAADGGSADEIHRLTWSQGVVPLLLVGSPEGVQLRNGFRFERGAGGKAVPWREALRTDPPDHRLAYLHAPRLRGSLAWRDYSPETADRVDSRLMGGIRALSEAVRAASGSLSERPDLINSLVGRMIYLFVLVDRGTIDQDWVDGLLHRGKPACPHIRLDDEQADEPWPVTEAWRLLDALDAELNGSVFPIPRQDRRLIDEATIHWVRRVIRKGDALEASGRQLSFLDVSFATLRTETISAIYELFLKLEGPTRQDADGAFYTPPFLADYMLDELDGYAPLGRHSRILDPAAGSGIFLVGSFRRIAESTAPAGGWTLERLGELKLLLSECIFGVERQTQAANVARFSLYLTLLDYAGSAPLGAIHAALDGEPLFPPMAENIICRDFFATARTGLRAFGPFTHVVGNPPWGQLKGGELPATEYLSRLPRSTSPVDNQRIEEAFLWKALLDHAADGAALALLLSTRCFVNPSARRFPAAVARAATVVGITNLSHFRYRLFGDARAPATALFLLAREATDLVPAWIHAPLLTSQPISVRGDPWSIIAGPGSFGHVRHAELRSSGWSRLLLLQPADRRNAALVVDGARGEHATLGDFLKRAGMIAHKGATPDRTGVAAEATLGGDPAKANYYRDRLGLDGGSRPPRQGTLPFEGARYRLDPQIVASLPAPYDRLFAGNVLVVTRHMAHFDMIERPAAFNSTFNIIAFACRASAVTRDVRRRTMRAIGRYLDSRLADYLFALVGRTWLLDGRRFEIGDLMAMPFPYQDIGDLTAADGADGTVRLTEALGLDGSFVEAVAQYAAHRRGYKDSQVPPDAQSSPDGPLAAAYLAALEAELGTSLGPRARLRLSHHPAHSRDFESITVSIGIDARDGAGSRGGEASGGAPGRDRNEPSFVGFNAGCAISYNPVTSTVRLLKPRTIAAWTVDRAYADRLAIVAEIARS